MYCNTPSCCRNGWTALHISASKGYEVIVRELLARGAAPNLVDKVSSRGHSSWGQLGVVFVIALRVRHVQAYTAHKAGDEPISESSRRGSGAEHACSRCRLSLTPFGTNACSRCCAVCIGALQDDRTALHLSAGRGHVSVIRDLLRKGADPLRRDMVRHEQCCVLLHSVCSSVGSQLRTLAVSACSRQYKARQAP